MSLELVIGKTIRGLRKQTGFRANELAKRVPMSRSYLSEIEQGHKIPSVALIGDLAKALEMEIADVWYFIYRNLKDVK